MAEYQLRFAAGKYWLLNMQQGMEYQSPVCLNESGAYLWKLYEQGWSRAEIAKYLADDYGLEWEKAWQDTNEFFNCFVQQD